MQMPSNTLDATNRSVPNDCFESNSDPQIISFGLLFISAGYMYTPSTVVGADRDLRARRRLQKQSSCPAAMRRQADRRLVAVQPRWPRASSETELFRTLGCWLIRSRRHALGSQEISHPMERRRARHLERVYLVAFHPGVAGFVVYCIAVVVVPRDRAGEQDDDDHAGMA